MSATETSLPLPDEMELQNKSRPQSSASHKAWDQDEPGQDDVDFSPRNRHALDLPDGVVLEPYGMQSPADEESVGCFIRFMKCIRGMYYICTYFCIRN